MSWSIGYDPTWKRDVGYGVLAYCDHPGCEESIDRGLSYVCGGEPYGGECRCGLYFCGAHLQHHKFRGDHRHGHFYCKRCVTYKPPYKPKPDHPEWLNHKATDPSWEEWRQQEASCKKSE